MYKQLEDAYVALMDAYSEGQDKRIGLIATQVNYLLEELEQEIGI